MMKWHTVIFLTLFGLGSLLQAAALEGEFSAKKHKKALFFLYSSLNTREHTVDEFQFKPAFGSGFALYFRLTPNELGFVPNKLMYLSWDNDFSGFLDGKFVYQTYPGFLMRTYIPFLKLQYGAGLNFKIGNQDYPVAGYYALAGIDFHKIVINSRALFHFNSRKVVGEIQMGILFSGKYR
jgi:hypothetical protein